MSNPIRTIDVNADVAEGGEDEALIPWVSSVNIACGYHAGDNTTINRAIRIAIQHGVSIGAHPSYEDRQGFGREDRPDVSPDQIEELILKQLRLLDDAVERAGGALAHIKLHGALYHRASMDWATAQATVSAIRSLGKRLRLILPAGSPSVGWARQSGFEVWEEGFADRGYAEGKLLKRGQPGALLDTPDQVALQGVALARDARPIRVDTLCLHGDHPNVVQNAQALRNALQTAGIGLRQ